MKVINIRLIGLKSIFLLKNMVNQKLQNSIYLFEGKYYNYLKVFRNK